MFATQPVEAGAFVLEYRGELISAEECRARDYTELQEASLVVSMETRMFCRDVENSMKICNTHN